MPLRSLISIIILVLLIFYNKEVSAYITKQKHAILLVQAKAVNYGNRMIAMNKLSRDCFSEFSKDEKNFKNCANKFNMNDVYIDIEKTVDSGKNVDYDNKDVSGLAQIPR